MSLFKLSNAIQINDKNDLISLPMEKYPINLPEKITVKYLSDISTNHITDFLNNNTADSDKLLHEYYHRDQIKFAVSHAKKTHAVALVFNDKIIGVCCVHICDAVIYKYRVDLPVCRFFCIYRTLRKIGLGSILMGVINNILLSDGYDKLYFSSDAGFLSNKLYPNFSTIRRLLIPINQQKLIKLGLLHESITFRNRFNINPLENMTDTDVKIIASKLNYRNSNYDFKPLYTNTSIQILRSKKHLALSYVKRSVDNQEVTDFISAKIEYYQLDNTDEIVSNAHVIFYYNETLTPAELFMFFIEKLIKYNIDQLSYDNTGENPSINITHFESVDIIKSYLIGASISKIPTHKICLNF